MSPERKKENERRNKSRLEREATKKMITFLQQLEETNDFLSIHNGGSDDSEIVAKLAGQMYDAEISIPGNQMFVVFQTNEEIVHKGFHALIIESKYFYQQSYPNLEITYQLHSIC